MLALVLQACVIGYLPGALLYRVPGTSQAFRANLTVEERAFWAITLSATWSLMTVIALALLGRYSLERLAIVDGAICLVLLGLFRGRLRYAVRARRPDATALVPILLIACGAWLYFPPSEYIIGGKDPGTYINEGVQIAQRGEILVRDPDVSSVPNQFRDLFFPSHHQSTYYGLRFMGFFIQNPDDGRVVGQFQHVYPASIAIGYDFNGLSGARQAIGVWTIFGLVAVFLTGRRLFGAMAGAAAAVLLSLNVIEVWFGRYPNSEMAMQTLLFAALLAAGRARDGGRVFFGIVAGSLLGVALFVRYEMLIAFAAFAAAGVVAPVTRDRLGWPFRIAFAVTSALGLWYLAGPMRAYFAYPLAFVSDHHGWLLGAAGVLAAVIAHRVMTWPAMQTLIRRWLPPALAVIVAMLAIYAYFFRHAGGRTALGDAIAFRSFGWYLTPPVLALAVAGAVLVIARQFWRDPPFFLTFLTFSIFFFYKTRIVAEHFWTARRFLPIALPGALVLAMAGVAALVALVVRRPSRAATAVSGIVVAAIAVPIGVTFWRAATPVRHHVEYAGLIPRLEQLAGRFGDRDLVLVESRNAGSDLHVLAPPLAYIYARHVLVLDSAVPPKDTLEAFVDWARTKYATIYFLGGGGTDLLSRNLNAVPVASDRFQVDEYDAPINAYPSGVRRKELEYGLYRLVPAAQAQSATIDLQIGALDDLNVVRFHAREQRSDGLRYRWTTGQSFVALPGIPATATQIVVWMSSGGRPSQAPAPVVEVALDDHVLGTATPIDDVRPYTFTLPPELAARAAARTDPARLRLRVSTWSPSALLGVNDTRELGVMLTRVEVR
jgi:hypothetical protein